MLAEPGMELRRGERQRLMRVLRGEGQAECERIGSRHRRGSDRGAFHGAHLAPKQSGLSGPAEV
jgi:hypothetical protein